jgi:glycosyltransferase involved in cell wall biosynthesis
MLLDTDLFAKTETEIFHHLVDRGYEIFLISGHAQQRLKFQNSKVHLFSIPTGKNSVPLKLHLIFALVQLFAFPIYILKTKPDFVILDWDSLIGLMPLLPFYRLLRMKIVLDVRSTPISLENSLQKIGLRMHMINLVFGISILIAKKKLDGMTIISDLMKEEITRKFGIDSDWVGVWSSGVSQELFRNEKYVQNAIDLRETLGLTNKFVIFYHGWFSGSRGLIDAINAIALLRTQYPDVVLFLLGTGSAQIISSMKQLIKNNELEGRVILHDAVDYSMVPEFISMCNIGIVPLLDLPQWRNQSPLKLLEYLAMKKVVMLSGLPCHREIIGDNKCGIFISTVSAAEIKRSIAFAYDNKERLGEWGAVGRAIVDKHYTWERIAENLDYYLKLVKKRGAHSSS